MAFQVAFHGDLQMSQSVPAGFRGFYLSSMGFQEVLGASKEFQGVPGAIQEI